ncbi:MAG TPA: DUF4384 domain-containing protein, partial [Acidobacteriota bacterium]|nr:DUF4384 domain-containing protein [Acidobacteriota bacterium]
LAKEVVFEKDYTIQLSFSSNESGYLYLINEGPVQRYDRPSYNVLFPRSNASAQLMPAEIVQIPSESDSARWIKFDEEAGTEKLWMIWADEPVAELEAVKSVANPQEKGVVSNPDQLTSLEKFFAERSKNKPVVERNERSTTVKATDKILVNLVPLEHY